MISEVRCRNVGEWVFDTFLENKESQFKVGDVMLPSDCWLLQFPDVVARNERRP